MTIYNFIEKIEQRFNETYPEKNKDAIVRHFSDHLDKYIDEMFLICSQEFRSNEFYLKLPDIDYLKKIDSKVKISLNNKENKSGQICPACKNYLQQEDYNNRFCGRCTLRFDEWDNQPLKCYNTLTGKYDLLMEVGGQNVYPINEAKIFYNDRMKNVNFINENKLKIVEFLKMVLVYCRKQKVKK